MKFSSFPLTNTVGNGDRCTSANHSGSDQDSYGCSRPYPGTADEGDGSSPHGF